MGTFVKKTPRQRRGRSGRNSRGWKLGGLQRFADGSRCQPAIGRASPGAGQPLRIGRKSFAWHCGAKASIGGLRRRKLSEGRKYARSEPVGRRQVSVSAGRRRAAGSAAGRCPGGLGRVASWGNDWSFVACSGGPSVVAASPVGAVVAVDVVAVGGVAAAGFAIAAMPVGTCPASAGKAAESGGFWGPISVAAGAWAFSGNHRRKARSARERLIQSTYPSSLRVTKASLNPPAWRWPRAWRCRIGCSSACNNP